MSKQIFEQHVDEHGNVSICVSKEFVVFTHDEAERLREMFDQLEAENAELRDERDCVGVAAYETGYKNGSVHYELEHCPACKNIADLQEALEENAKLRELMLDMLLYYAMPGAPDYKREAGLLERAHEMGVEVSE